MNEPQWRKSTFSSDQGNCVELADLGGGVIGVRDSKLGNESPILRFDRSSVTALLGAARSGGLDGLL